MLPAVGAIVNAKSAAVAPLAAGRGRDHPTTAIVARTAAAAQASHG
jgi:hypothetical protein